MDAAAVRTFRIDSGDLASAIDRFSEQTGLQVVYETAQLSGRVAAAVNGKLRISQALQRLLAGTGLRWQFTGEGTVAIFRSAVRRGSEGANPTAPSITARLETQDTAPRSKQDIATLSDVQVQAQRWMRSSSSEGVFGFNKPLLDTPRSVSTVNEQTIDMFGLSAVEDLTRVAPSVFTTTRFGIQGSVDVRAIPADTYFRGMKRLTLQGHGRSVLAALDSIDIVGGAPSVLYDPGKFGGYTNVVPKSGRARNGKYLQRAEGFIELIGGSYDRREMSFGFGGPVTTLQRHGRRGGYYVYGLVEDSKSFAKGVPVKQKLLQAASSIDDAAGKLRLEIGVNLQESRTAGALIGRFTQQLADEQRYIGGAPLVNLDSDGDGSIGYYEMQRNSPVAGALSATNQPLNQVWAWPVDAAGVPLRVEQFPKVSGIPSSLYDYLVAHPQADPNGRLRAQGIGGPVPLSGSVPIGMALDPRTVAFKTLDLRQSSAFERELQARFVTAYADLIYDQNPNATFKNQLFLDRMDQYKSSNQPFSQQQHVTVLEDKLTLGRHWTDGPRWLDAQALLSLNARTTTSRGRMSLADYGNHRSDATADDWNPAVGGLTANTTFTSAVENSDIDRDGLPWFSIYRSEIDEFGVGALLDASLVQGTNVMLGGRLDRSRASNTDYAGRYNTNTGTAAAPGAYVTSDDTASAWDGGASWSISFSQRLPHDVRPYISWSRSSILLDNNNNSFSNAVIRAGHVGAAYMKEIGVKGLLFDDRLSLTSSLYEQGRSGVNVDDDVNVLNAYASATTTNGWQTELNWSPSRSVMLSGYLLRQSTRYTPNVGGILQVDARALGFQDVLDDAGNIVFPAEAFLYGGRARIVLPNDVAAYAHKQGNPNTQIAVSGLFELSADFGITLRGTYLSSTCLGRLCLVRLAASRTYDAGVSWDRGRWQLKFDVLNVTDERYFRARTGDNLGDVIAQAMPARRWQMSLRFDR